MSTAFVNRDYEARLRLGTWMIDSLRKKLPLAIASDGSHQHDGSRPWSFQQRAESSSCCALPSYGESNGNYGAIVCRVPCLSKFCGRIFEPPCGWDKSEAAAGSSPVDRNASGKPDDPGGRLSSFISEDDFRIHNSDVTGFQCTRLVHFTFWDVFLLAWKESILKQLAAMSSGISLGTTIAISPSRRFDGDESQDREARQDEAETEVDTDVDVWGCRW